MTSAKRGLRAQVAAARRQVTEAVHTAEAIAIAARVSDLVEPGDTVCAYAPVGSEPGSVAMLDALHSRAARVLLPVARTSDDGTPLPLAWAEYQPGTLVAAQLGLLEPTGPVLPPDTLAGARVVFVPALAADRRGVRLGRGAGFYDRSLPLADPAARLVVIVRDEELFDEIPAEAHDVRMTDVLTPSGVITVL